MITLKIEKDQYVLTRIYDGHPTHQNVFKAWINKQGIMTKSEGYSRVKEDDQWEDNLYERLSIEYDSRNHPTKLIAEGDEFLDNFGYSPIIYDFKFDEYGTILEFKNNKGDWWDKKVFGSDIPFKDDILYNYFCWACTRAYSNMIEYEDISEDLNMPDMGTQADIHVHRMYEIFEWANDGDVEE